MISVAEPSVARLGAAGVETLAVPLVQLGGGRAYRRSLGFARDDKGWSGASMRIGLVADGSLGLASNEGTGR
jgi:hypothetical protein